MTDSTIPAEDAGISRRRALQAGVGAGVGLVAWSGPTITSLGGTPAYAAVCTNFTFSLAVTDMSTNQSSGCDTFSYNNSPPIQVKASGYGWDLPGGGNFQCADTPGTAYHFTFPTGDTCQVTIMVHRNHYSESTVIIGAKTVSQGTGGSLTFYLPSNTGDGTPQQGCPFTDAFLTGIDSNVSPTFWSVWINCVSSTDSGCDLPEIPTPGPPLPGC